MIIHIESWNTTQLFEGNQMFTGNNKELYVANINNPNKIFTDLYTNDTYVEWAEKQSTTEAILNYKGQYWWNLRYGSLLLAEETTDSSKYKFDITNNGESDCYIKFYNNIQSKNFDDIVGLNTNKSDSTNKQAIKIMPSETLQIELEVSDSNPIFFKCSDGAEITFGNSLIKEEE